MHWEHLKLVILMVHGRHFLHKTQYMESPILRKSYTRDPNVGKTFSPYEDISFELYF